MKLLIVLLSFFTASAFAEEISLFDEPIISLTSFVSSETGKPIIVASNLTSTLISVDGSYSNNDELLSLLKAVVDTNGLTINFSDGFYRISKGEKKDKKSTDSLKVYTFTNIRPEHFIGNLPKSSSDVKVSIIPNSSSVAFVGDDEGISLMTDYAQAFDIKPRQVLIESVILETNDTNSQSVGVFIRSKLSSSGFSASSNTSLGPVDLNVKGAVLSYLSGGDLRFFINAVKTNDDISILSEPKILAMDRQESTFTVGQNVPFLTSSEATDGGKVIQQIERKDVGLVVRVKPELIGNDIRLTIFQEISNVTNSTIASDIITNKRSLSTVARVTSGDTVVIGGLISKDVQALNNKVPVLSSVPFVGRAFTSDTETTVSRELKLLIKATII